jgi:putative membrane protein
MLWERSLRRSVVMMNWYGGWGAGGWLLMSLIMLAVIAVIVVGVVALSRRSSRSTPLPPADSDAGSAALSTLDDRYARGEIDDAEYRRRRELLTPDR